MNRMSYTWEVGLLHRKAFRIILDQTQFMYDDQLKYIEHKGLFGSVFIVSGSNTALAMVSQRWTSYVNSLTHLYVIKCSREQFGALKETLDILNVSIASKSGIFTRKISFYATMNERDELEELLADQNLIIEKETSHG